MRESFKKRFDRIKNRNISFENVLGFLSPECFTIFNNSVKQIERRREKKYSNKDYTILMIRYNQDEDFNNQCLNYLSDKTKITRPVLSRINKWKDYNVENIELREQRFKKENSNFIRDPFMSISQNMNNSVGYDFLISNFTSPEKIRFLLSCIKLNYNLSVKDKREYLLMFYDDVVFVKYYNTFIRTGNKFIKPTLNRKTHVSRGGDNNLCNLQFMSYLEHISKCDMNQQEWDFVKNNLNEFMGFE